MIWVDMDLVWCFRGEGLKEKKVSLGIFKNPEANTVEGGGKTY